MPTHPDLLAGFQNEDFSGRRLQVLIGNGAGRFRDEIAQRLPEQDAGAGWPYAIRLADVNGDGRLDFGVSVHGANERAPLYLDDGSGTYHPLPIHSSQFMFVYSDANGDRRPDIASISGNNTEQLDVQLQLVAPVAPVRLRAAPIPGGIRVSWTPVPGADRYEVWRSAPRLRRRLIASTPQPPFKDGTARRGVRYTYVARSVNELGKSPFSASATSRRP